MASEQSVQTPSFFSKYYDKGQCISNKNCFYYLWLPGILEGQDLVKGTYAYFCACHKKPGFRSPRVGQLAAKDRNFVIRRLITKISWLYLKKLTILNLIFLRGIFLFLSAESSESIIAIKMANTCIFFSKKKWPTITLNEEFNEIECCSSQYSGKNRVTLTMKPIEAGRQFSMIKQLH